METWQWQGQPLKDWPKWLTFKNFAAGRGMISIPQFEGTVIAHLGDWIDKAPDGFISVRKPDPSWDERHFRELESSF